jgi:mannose-6-phosphate isomerase
VPESPAVFAIEGVPRYYAWGSPTTIPALLGQPADGRPVAELWFGAHPHDPSPALGTTLDAVIAADPTGLLGAGVVGRWGPRLPFLVKILAADVPLSIQVHPNLAQARAGFAAEDAAGIRADAPERNYRDANHKPELLCALTEFEALCGFRPVTATLRLLDALALPDLEPVRTGLAGPGGLCAAFTYLLSLADPVPLATSVALAAPGLPTEFAGAARAVELATAEFPGDVGVVVSLLLNYVRLAPGQAIFLAAGNVHAYLRGTGVEVMASSDNVLRCGLTPKHVDVDELLSVTDFTELPDPVVAIEQLDAATWRYPAPVADFEVRRVELGADTRDEQRGGGPTVVLAVGSASVSADGVVVDLAPGRAAMVRPAATWALSGSGTAVLVTATVGDPG